MSSWQHSFKGKALRSKLCPASCRHNMAGYFESLQAFATGAVCDAWNSDHHACQSTRRSTNARPSMLEKVMPSAGDGHHREGRQTTVCCDRAATQQGSSAGYGRIQ
ncbi:TPA: hypothetical protein ACH3X2_000659 [Trebouxia sp. C0005]